jgi:7-cyano-7-deazaguanine synthase
MTKKAVILFSGGLDSATCLALAKSQGFACYALSFDYGQRHRVELEAAKNVAQIMGAAEHRIVKLSIGELGGSALTDHTLAIPDYAGDEEIPITYVPARNTIFLAIALGWAEILEAYDIFIGTSSVDYSGYPDCRPEFINAFQQLANLATKCGVEGETFTIRAPLIHLSKAETVRLGMKLKVDYSQTISCYQADEQGRACGRCDSCALRRRGFIDAQIPDPTRYLQT